MIKYYVLSVIGTLALVCIGLPLYSVCPKFISYTDAIFLILNPVIAWYFNKHMSENNIRDTARNNIKFLAVTLGCAALDTLYACLLYGDVSIILIGILVYVIAIFVPTVTVMVLYLILFAKKDHSRSMDVEHDQIKRRSLIIQPVVAACIIIVTVILYCFLLLNKNFDDYWEIEDIIFAMIPTIGLAHGLYHQSRWRSPALSVWYSIISLVTSFAFLFVYSAASYPIMMNCSSGTGYDTRYNIFLNSSFGSTLLVPIIHTLIVCIPLFIAVAIRYLIGKMKNT